MCKFEITAKDLGISACHWHLTSVWKGRVYIDENSCKGKKSEFGKVHDSLDALKHSQENNTQISVCLVSWGTF